MKKYPCPSCGAEIPFRTSITAHAVCPYCRTMVVRDDEGLSKTGEMAQLPDDMSPFQIGTEGVFRGVRFGIVGRVKMGWEYGAWNEWFIVSDDARRGWLAEAQGFYSPCFEVTAFEEKQFQRLTDLVNRVEDGDAARAMGRRYPLGQRFTIGEKPFKVVDVKEAECIGSEGELPYKTPKGQKRRSMDLVFGHGDFASIEFENGHFSVFEGAYVSWDDLRCKYYREFEGW